MAVPRRPISVSDSKDSNLSEARVLVTGGSGFIGSHLVRRLLKEGQEVLVVDNFSSGTRANLADLFGHPRLEVGRHDVTFPPYVEVDEIYHSACPASPVFYQRDPVQTTKTSVVGSINMLGLAKRTKARILLASTPLRFMATRKCTPRTRVIGVTSIPLAPGRVTTRVSAAPRRCSSTTDDSTTCRSRSRNLQHIRTPNAARRRPGGVSNFIVSASAAGR